jgi:hypothetical protein
VQQYEIDPIEDNYSQLLLAGTLPASIFVILMLGIFGFRIRNRN